MTTNCVFCQIAAGQKQTEIVYQDDQVTAFHDASPQAPTHILVIPNRHIPNLNETGNGDANLLGALFAVAREIAAQEGLADDGYRLVLNTGPDAGQSVHHLHLHLLGGRRMRWPPG
jgi:histidine triad (HIT) family protein